MTRNWRNRRLVRQLMFSYQFSQDSNEFIIEKLPYLIGVFRGGSLSFLTVKPQQCWQEFLLTIINKRKMIHREDQSCRPDAKCSKTPLPSSANPCLSPRRNPNTYNSPATTWAASLGSQLPADPCLIMPQHGSSQSQHIINSNGCAASLVHLGIMHKLRNAILA